MSIISIIIPFLNEKEEVELTLKSLFEHTDIPVDVILINDASDDRYDYDILEKKYGVTYIKNTSRLGVAKCRDLGISKVQTPYFLLLDAHMRFYDKSWAKMVLAELERDKHTLLCCQSVVIRKVCNELLEQPELKAYGAYMNIHPDSTEFLNVNWINSQDTHEVVEEIPCVLGAAYACHKAYWEYLRGLNGLNQYGLDEQFISIKVWLSGGTCKLLNNVFIGHIYRTYAPYQVDSVDMLYNKMLIVELLCPNHIKYQYFSVLKRERKNLYHKAYSMLQEKKVWIDSQRAYFAQIAKRNFTEIINLNQKYDLDTPNEKPSFENMERQVIFFLAHSHEYQGNSIFNGRCALIMLSLLWAKASKNILFEQFAECYLQQIYESISLATNMHFSDGLLGIGWCFEFLMQNRLIDGDANEILEEIDRQVMTIRCDKLQDCSLATGLKGIAAYVLARIKGCLLSSHSIPFDQDFLNALHARIVEYLLGKESVDEFVDIEIQTLDLLDKKCDVNSVCPLNKEDILLLFKLMKMEKLPVLNCISNLM